jgi:hypothetical protein
MCQTTSRPLVSSRQTMSLAAATPPVPGP